jgi:hypothetical protein
MSTDPAPAVEKFRSASRWKRRHLEDLLNVKYDPREEHTFDFESIQLPHELSQRICFFMTIFDF